MERHITSLDLNSKIGSVTLSNGQSLDIPKLSLHKIIKIVKFLGIDGARLYAECRDILLDESKDTLEQFAIILETLEEEQLVRVFSIMLDLEDKEVLSLDPNEFLEIAVVLADSVDLKKTYFLIRQLMQKMFKKELPENLGEWWKNLQIKAQQMRNEKLKQMASSDSSTSSSDKSK